MKLTSLLCASLVLLLAGCNKAPSDSQASQSVELQLAEITSAKTNLVTPEQVAEVFALGSEFTDLQRDLVHKELAGNVVEWDIPVYEISYEGGVYEVTSLAFDIKSADAIKILRAKIAVYPQNDADHELLRRAKTNDRLRIRGRVQDIVLRMSSPACL